MQNVIIFGFNSNPYRSKAQGICFTIAESRKHCKYGRRGINRKWDVYRKSAVSCLTREPYFFYLSGILSFFMVAQV